MPAPSRKMGSRRWELAVAEAALSRREKALCYALLPYIRWETGEARVSTATLERASGWKARALQGAARDLAARGVLSYPYGREGGRRPDNTGIANVVRLDLAALEALKGAPRAPIRKSAPGAGDGRTPCGGWAHAATEMGAPGADKQLREQPQGTTTTTTAGGAVVEARKPVGGGGGGEAFSSGGGEAGEAEADAALQPGPHDPGESRRMLLEFGLTVGKADTLAPLHAPEVISAGIYWLRHNGDGARSKPAILVKILGDGTALEKWREGEHRRREAARAREAQERLDRRCGALAAAFNAAMESDDEAIREETRRRSRVIWRTWRHPEDLIRAGAVPDELLLAETLNATAIIDAAYAAALAAAPSGTSNLNHRDVAAPVSAGNSREGGR